MKIKRNINGVEMEIELTQQEMWSVFNEVQHESDMETIRCRFDLFEDIHAISEYYDMAWTEIKSLIPEIAYLYREYVEGSEDCDRQLEEAIVDVLNEYR